MIMEEGWRVGDNGFAEAYEAWLKKHYYLHPEYEVIDFKGGRRFLDFAYIRYPLRLSIDIDDFGSHVTNMSRWGFCDSNNRQNHLTNDRWKIIRFSLDDVKHNPRMCIQTLQQFMQVYSAEAGRTTSIDELVEKEVLRLALALERPLRMQDICAYLTTYFPGNGESAIIMSYLPKYKRPVLQYDRVRG